MTFSKMTLRFARVYTDEAEARDRAKFWRGCMGAEVKVFRRTVRAGGVGCDGTDAAEPALGEV